MNVRVVGLFTSAHLLKLMQVRVLNNISFYILGSFFEKKNPF